mgnify:CR=1 FL=1
MSIKCSLLGHRFGETTVDRDREEDGTEVVITITEFETCTRCGETRVVSENKEVTTLEDADAGNEAGSAVDAGATDAPATGPGNATDADGTDGAAADDTAADVAEGRDAEIIDGTDSETTAQATARGTDGTVPDAETGTAGGSTATDEDDAVVIDAEGGEPVDADGSAGADDGDGDEKRQPGEWPEEPDGRDAAERAGETAEAEILGDDGDAGDAGDPAVADAGAASGPASGGPASGGAGGTAGVGDATDAADGTDGDQGAANAAVGADSEAAAWPEESGDAAAESTSEVMDDWPEETKRDEGADPGAAGPSLDGDDAGAVTVPEGMFKCTECGFTTEVESSSLRAGDFCPECHRGTLLQDTDADAE